MLRKFALLLSVFLVAWTAYAAATSSPPAQASEATLPGQNGTLPNSTEPLPGPKMPDWFPIAPPLMAIVIALLFRNVIPALFLGVWLGAAGLHGLDLAGIVWGLADTFNIFVRGALADDSHAAILLFSLMIGGMVGIVMRNGGMQGVVNHIARWANSSRSAQVGTAALGFGIFFDDYANSLVVGNTMRPVTDRMRISREKLAYLVDSTAAPVSCIAFVTTWIGAEVGYIQDGLNKVASGTGDANAYSLFLQSLTYSFYPVLALFFVLVVAWTGRDFGPMLKAERRARRTGQSSRPGAKLDDAAGEEGIKPKEGKPCRAFNAVLPILTMLLTVILGLGITGAQNIDAPFTIADHVDRGAPIADQVRGFGAYLQELCRQDLGKLIGASDSYAALMWGSILGMLCAAVLSLIQGILRLHEVVDAWYEGVKAMMMAMFVLVLAWSLSSVTEQLDTATYIHQALGSSLQIEYLPVVVFALAAGTAFATGTSWGTMAILMPLVVPLSWGMLVEGEVANPGSHAILLSSIASVLAGAVWGDHCSPISDTTVLSSMASGCDHIDHVRTQLPYALLVGVVSIGVGIIPTAFGVPWYLCMPLGAVALIGAAFLLGKKADDQLPPDQEPGEEPGPETDLHESVTLKA